MTDCSRSPENTSPDLRDPAISVTVFDAGHSARAWTGRPSNVSLDPMPADRLVFVSVGVRDLRLVHVEPLAIIEVGDDRPRRAGAVVAERVLSRTPRIVSSSLGGFQVSTSIADVTLRPHQDGEVVSEPYRFVLETPAGASLARGRRAGERPQPDPRRLETSRAGDGIGLLGQPCFGLGGDAPHSPARCRSGPTARRRDIGRRSRVGCLCAFGLLWLAPSLVPARFSLVDPTTYRSAWFAGILRHPVDLLLGGLLLLGLVVVATYAIERTRLGGYAGRQPLPRGPTRSFVLTQLSGGVLATAGLWGLARLIGDTFQNASVDLLHTSLQPWDSGRVTLLLGVLLVSVATFWGCDADSFLRSVYRGPPVIAPGVGGCSSARSWCAPGMVLALGGLLPAWRRCRSWSRRPRRLSRCQ